MPRSATPSAIMPTISSLRRSSRSTLTFGCAARNELKRFRQKFGQRVGVGQNPDLAGEAAAIGAEIFVQALGLTQNGARMLQQGAAGLGRGDALAAAREQRDAERLSILRMRVEAAASARFERCAPWVMLPASTTWRNRLRSARSKRTVDASLRIYEAIFE